MIDIAVVKVSEVVRKLVEDGFLVRKGATDTRPIYSLNKDKLNEIQEYLDGLHT